MNGRVYDPMIGRFGAPDPMTESPYSTQGWNRYSYVGNSPLNFADPSGYCFLGCFWQAPGKALGGALRRIPILGNILTVAASVIACGPGFSACAVAISAITSAATTGLASGDIGQALKAGIITAATAIAFQGLGDITGHTPGFGTTDHIKNIIGHAAIGCGSAVASGGKCGPGALSGAVGSFATPLTRGLDFTSRLVAVSTIGGLASVAGGGKFANGATTAAFGYLFNHLSHSDERGNEISGEPQGSPGVRTAFCPPCAVVGAAELIAATVNGVAALSIGIYDLLSDESYPSVLYHYTSEVGMEGIVASGVINPSLKAVNPNDARYGDGQYFSDIIPGTKTSAQLSRTFIGNPFQGNRFSHYVGVNVQGLPVVPGRPNVYVVPNQTPLNVRHRITSFGSN